MKSEHNSTRCAGCHRLMPRKSGKRLTCSTACERVAKTVSNNRASWKPSRVRGRPLNWRCEEKPAQAANRPIPSQPRTTPPKAIAYVAPGGYVVRLQCANWGGWL